MSEIWTSRALTVHILVHVHIYPQLHIPIVGCDISLNELGIRGIETAVKKEATSGKETWQI